MKKRTIWAIVGTFAFMYAIYSLQKDWKSAIVFFFIALMSIVWIIVEYLKEKK